MKDTTTIRKPNLRTNTAILGLWLILLASWMRDTPELRAATAAIPGSVTVTIQPTNAVADGARWTLDGGSEQPAGFQQQDVAPGHHTVRFGDLGAWREPQALEVLVIGGKEAQVAATFTSIPTFDFQAVPEQHARHGETIEFFVTTENPTSQLQVAATPLPVGPLAFDPATGRFTYTPAAADRLPFSLTLSTGGVQSATTTITPLPDLPAEEIVIDYERALPDDESRDYITISESKNAAELFNDATNETLNVDISGKTLVFANDHPASLHRQYNGRENIKNLRLYADRVIIRSPLVLLQTHVSIHARELRFERDGLIDTTPKARVKKPTAAVWEDNLTRGIDGDPGHKGGDVDVLVERFVADSTQPKLLILRGGKGGPAGEGRNGLPENTRNPDGTALFPFLSANWHRLMARSGNPVCGSTLLSAVILHLEDRMESPTEFCGRKVTAHSESAVPSGKPGNGGAGGTLRSTLDLTPFATLSGDSAGAKGSDYVAAPRPTRIFVYRVIRPTLPDGEPRTTDTAAPKAAGTNVTAPNATIPVGATGTLELVPEPGAWLHSFAVGSVIQFAKDAYLNGHELEARSLLTEYRDLVRALQPVLPDGVEPSGEVFTEKTSLDQLVLEMETLIHRIDSNLDFFGNPAGWVPMLSFEANLVAFQNEVDQSIPILYLTYWLSQAATNLANSLQASEFAHGKLKTEFDKMVVDFNEAQTAIPRLRIEASAIGTRISVMQGRLRILLEQLEERARQNVEERHKVPFWKKAIGTLAVASHLVPVGQPLVGQIGTGLGQLAQVDPENPLQSAAAITNVFDVFSQKNITVCFGGATTNGTNSGTSTNRLKELSECGKFLGGELKQLAAVFKGTQIDSKEVQAEFEKIKASDFAFKQITKDLEELNKEKERFSLELAAALQAVTGLTSAMTENLLATHSLEDRIANALTTLDHNALLHIKEMERRAKDRLLKFQYFAAKAFQHRTLRPYSGNLQLNRLFDRFQALVEGGNSHVLSAEEFANLKSLYVAELRDIIAQAFDILNSNAPERSVPISFRLTDEELRQLNNDGQIVINLQKRGLFPTSHENIRIADLRTRTLTVHPVGGNVGAHALLFVDFEHLGVSRLTADGQTFLFRHYLTEAVNPITWNTVYDGVADTFNNSVLSPAAQSLIRTLLNQPSAEDLLLFSRPAAAADILIRKEVRTANGIDLVIDELRVEVQYEFFQTSASQPELEVVVTDDLEPFIALSQPDLNGRRDGQGDFRRVFPVGAVVTLEAPASYGGFDFDRWVVNGQARAAGETSVALTLRTATKAEARFGGATSNTAPQIVEQPQDAIATVGSTATFTVAATGSEPLTFRWRKDGAPLTDGGRFSGSATATLTITNVGLSESGAYSIVVSNASGTVTSQVALLVVTAPALSSVPAAPGSVGFQFPTIAGLRYVIERKFKLDDPEWTTVEVITGTGGRMQFTRPTSAGASFFRLRVDESSSE